MKFCLFLVFLLFAVSAEAAVRNPCYQDLSGSCYSMAGYTGTDMLDIKENLYQTQNINTFYTQLQGLYTGGYQLTKLTSNSFSASMGVASYTGYCYCDGGGLFFSSVF